MAHGGLLIDTGFFYAYFNARDKYHATANELSGILKFFPVIVPWPVMYETLNTRFCRRPDWVNDFDTICSLPDATLLDDTPYREAAYALIKLSSQRRIALSLVDAILTGVVEDPNVPIQAMLTFNPGDFHSVCAQHRVEIVQG